MSARESVWIIATVIITRSLLTRYGWIDDLTVPRLRKGRIESQVFDRYRRRQRQIDKVLLEGFLLGHSTRKTRRVFARLFGETMSAQTVSNIVKELDEKVKQFHRRELCSEYQFIYLDGLWITLRSPLKVKKVLLVALGKRYDGETELVSFQLAPSESESCWWGFILDMKERGLKEMEMVISDNALGLTKAIREGYTLLALYPRIIHQLCTFHKANDLGHHLYDSKHRRRIINDALYIFEGQTITEVRRRLKIFTEKWSEKEPKAIRNFKEGVSLHKNFEYCLSYLSYSEPYRTMLKTSNPVERYLQELRRRIIPMRAFNNAKSVERIIYGIVTYVLNQKLDMPHYQFTQFN
ncbi:MAG: IS256 family transposase [FCB group bacterium]|nr:IS256 family transposase [FCB group bacterium]